MRGVTTLRGLLGAALFALAALAGCGGGGTGFLLTDAAPVEPAPGPEPAPAPAPEPAPAPAPAPVLLAFQTGGGLQVSAVLPQDGSLRPLYAYASADLGGFPLATAADPLGRFVLVLLGQPDGSKAWMAFGLDGSGRLVTPGVPATTVTEGTRTPIFSGDGKFLYLANGRYQVHAFKVADDGHLAELAGSPFGTAEGTNASDELVLDPGGRLLYVQTFSGFATAVRVFTLDPTTGAPSPVARDPATAAGELGRIAPAGPGRAWVQQTDGRWTLYQVDTNTGALAPAQPASSIGPLGGAWDFGVGVATDATGRVVLAVSAPNGINKRPYQLQAYVFDEGANTLAATGAPLAADTGAPWRDAAGYFHQANLVLDADPVTGLRLLANTSSSPTATLAAPAAAAPRAVSYALDADAAQVRVLQVDAASGALLPVAGGTASVTGRPVALAVRPTVGVLAVASSSGTDPGTLATFLIDRATGLLTTMASLPTGVAPTAVTFWGDATLYVSHRDGIDAFAFDPVAGTLRKLAGSPFPTGYTAQNETYTGGFPQIVAGQPVTDRPAADMATGRNFLFLATNKGSDGWLSTLQGLSQVSGGRADCGYRASPSSFSASGSGTVAVAAVPDGSLVYTANRDSNTVAGFRANYDVCFEPTMPPVAGSPFADGMQPVALAMDPAGMYLFAANAAGAGSVSVYAIRPFTGLLAEVAGSPFAAGRVPAHLWTDAQGRFLYTSNAAGEVKVQAVDRATGALDAARAAFAGGRAQLARDVVLRIQ